jgi:hypothetical protein
MNESLNNNQDGENNFSELGIYFEDIIRNKDMIKDMFNTNILVYEDKLRSNEETLNEKKDEYNRLMNDFTLIENKLKLEYAKNHEELQKYEINYKLLEKTHSHYKTLIREREEEIKKLEQQSIFAYQDYQNKKVKLDCINVQIIEAEFQLKNLQKRLTEKMSKVTSIMKEEDEERKTSCDRSVMSDENRGKLQIKPTKEIKDVEKFLTDKMEYKSSYNRSNTLPIPTKNDQSDFINQENQQTSTLRESISISHHNDIMMRNKCLIF